MTQIEERDVNFQAYARLITMLSEQLIRNETVALSELVKNCYDADSDWVKISFINFNEKFKPKNNAKIIIEDCGDGMTESILTNDFMNPASANKKLAKKDGFKTKKGRVLQGEKGIGRFSLFKLGKKATVYTKTYDDPNVRKLVIDLSDYNEDFVKNNNQLMLDSISAKYISHTDEMDFYGDIYIDNLKKKRKGKGTIIEIENLNDVWGKRKFDSLMNELYTLLGKEGENDFSISVYKDHSFLAEDVISSKTILNNLLEQKSVLKIHGQYNEDLQQFQFNVNGKNEVISLLDKKISGLHTFRNSFNEKLSEAEESFKNALTTKNEKIKSKNENLIETECGSFNFRYYIFDLDKSGLKSKYKLDSIQKDIVSQNRVYVYRDGVRVLPYGSKTDDWLQVDKVRANYRPSAMFSNEQLVGFVGITYNENPKLMDKTNREGLIEYGNAYNDFVSLNQVFLQYIKQNYYQDHVSKKEQIKKFEKNDFKKVNDEFEQIISEVNDEKIKKKILALYSRVDQQNTYNISRIKVVENLAGIGLSISATHHDLMNFIRRCYNLLDVLYKQLNAENDEYVSKFSIIETIERLRGLVSSMESLLNDMQSLFAASNQKVSNIKVSSMIDRVLGYYKSVLESKNIRFDIKQIGISPLVVKIPEASLLTIFINLFDNAIYWLENQFTSERRIQLILNSEENYFLFADSGPGIDDEDKEKVFEAFYTGKGIEGRGLGLYICRQFLERFDYQIYLKNKEEYSLEGASFILDFNKDDKEE